MALEKCTVDERITPFSTIKQVGWANMSFFSLNTKIAVGYYTCINWPVRTDHHAPKTMEQSVDGRLESNLYADDDDGLQNRNTSMLQQHAHCTCRGEEKKKKNWERKTKRKRAEHAHDQSSIHQFTLGNNSINLTRLLTSLDVTNDIVYGFHLHVIVDNHLHFAAAETQHEY